MSVRAYKVIEIITEDIPAFNLWHDTWLVEHLGFEDQLGEDGVGLIWISKEDVEGAIDELKKSKPEDFEDNEEKEYTEKTLNELLKQIKDSKFGDGIQFYCF